MLAGEELLAKVDSSTLDASPSRYNSPNGHWVGVAARETVMVYNPDLIAAGELPASILDLAKPEWKGKLAIAPSEPDFVPIVSAIEKLDGEAAAKSWLEGFAANAKHYNDNEGIIAAVDDGQIAAGIINHYYWYEAVAEEGKDKVASKLHYFGNEDPGRAGQRLRRRRAGLERRPRARPGIPRLPGQQGRPGRDDRKRRLGVPAERRRAATARAEAVRQPRTARRSARPTSATAARRSN